MAGFFLQVGKLSRVQSKDRHDVDKRPRATTCTDAALNQQTGAAIDLFRQVPFTSTRQQRVDPATPILMCGGTRTPANGRLKQCGNKTRLPRVSNMVALPVALIASCEAPSKAVLIRRFDQVQVSVWAPRPSFSPEAGAHFSWAPGNDRVQK
jgi:hypothetical protein